MSHKSVKRRLSHILMTAAVCLLAAAMLCSCSVEITFPDSEQTTAPAAASSAEKATEPSEQEAKPLSVHFLDIGQGDSIFVELPNKKTMLIDTGGDYHGQGIIDYITEAGYKKIDYLVGTHPHADHIGSMGYIVRNFPIKNIYMPKVSANTKLYEDLLKSVKSRGLTVKAGKAGVNIMKSGKCSADIIAPYTIDEENLNNSSIMIKLTYGEVSFLFTGDAERAELSSVKADMQATVLKVGHHGSSRSTTRELLNMVKPKAAVISCGAGNDYGHPHKEVLSLLGEAGCKVYRTDLQKTIRITTDGIHYKTKTNIKSIEEAK